MRVILAYNRSTAVIKLDTKKIIKLKESKIAAVPTACSFGGTIIGGWLIDCASKGKCCLSAAILDFFAMSSTPQGVKTHLSIGHEPQGTIDKLEVCFYLKPSLIIMTFIKCA